MMAIYMTYVLETSRLALREIVLSDLDFLAEVLGNPQVMEYWSKCYSRKESHQWLLKQQIRYRQDGYGFWLVLEKEKLQPVGQVGLMKIKIEEQEEIALGYIIHAPFWKKGFAFEASQACIDYAFSNLEAMRVIALIRAENVPSRNMAKKLGMKPDGEMIYAGYKHIIFETVKEKN